MKKALLGGILFTVLLARPASGEGINLSWSDCGIAGTMMKTFACDTNLGEQALVGSFVPPAGFDQINGMAGVVDLCSMDPVLPAWWQVGSPTRCRPTAVIADFDFTSGFGSCADYWRGAAAGGLDVRIGAAWDFNAARFVVVAAIPSGAEMATDPSTEYYAFRLVIRNFATVGSGSCAGCTSRCCIVFNSLLLTQPAGIGDVTLSYPADNYYVQWQGPVDNCPFVVPTLRPSWGQIKSLYR